MRESERDVLVLLLALAAGSADAWSFLGVGHVFTANMTGNTVLLGIALASGRHEMIARPAISIACFAAGVAIGALLTGEVDEKQIWLRKISTVLACEGTLLALTAWLWTTRYPIHGILTQRTLIGIAAVALGMQSGTMQKVGIPGVVTTYISGTWTTLMSGITKLTTGKSPKPAPHAKKRWEERLMMQAGVIAIYGMSAALTAWTLHSAPRAAPAIPAAAVLLVAIYGAARGVHARAI